MLVKTLVGLLIVFAVGIFTARKVSSTVHVDRTVNAPLAKVWQVWTDVESMKKWWSPKDYTAPVINSDFQVGGSFLYSMRSPKGDMHWNTGKYTEIVPNQKIVSNMSFSDENGKIVPGSEVQVPGVWPDEISVSVEFKDVGGKTQILITEVGIPAIMKIPAKMGWEQQLDKFEALLN
ncbi:MAG TPA: SRPBCC domain-containing protein [Oligoflexus sp.]|uniref:SRPBCC family protein n=1 Tax=Oligoflexus sp. TaxID=1971216 RepID=UPI002D4D331C|nr:SRPBCC domain-containing protein [Oligoflexus sp.]HYX38944.1 SRPBCC domain-containing protein [Oligoflexus sp.]